MNEKSSRFDWTAAVAAEAENNYLFEYFDDVK